MRSAAECSSQSPTGRTLFDCAARVHRRQKQKVNGKGRSYRDSVRAEKSLIYKASYTEQEQ